MSLTDGYIAQLAATLAQPSQNTMPLYLRLYEALRAQIIQGLWLPHLPLPASRVMAQQLGVGRNTVLAALEQLIAEGYVRTQLGSGVYVVPTAPLNWQATPLNIPRVQMGLSLRGQVLTGPTAWHPMRGAFALGVPDLTQFPFALWQRYVARHTRNPQLPWQHHQQQGGLHELRATLANHVRLARGIVCQPEQIIITHGTQHSLRLLADLLADPTDPVWIEDPGYSGAYHAFAAAGLTIHAQPVDAEGLAPPPLAWQQTPRLIYTTPSHQFPTGVVMSAARRRDLLAAAAHHDAWVIEDDYDSEFRYAGAPLAALYALAPHHVIYLGTFSKTFFPTLRMGYMIVPERLVDAFCIAQARHYREPSYIMQKALADFIRDGHAEAHIRTMRRNYQQRRDILITLLTRQLGNNIQLQGVDTGLHLLAYLNTDADDRHIAVTACAQGIMVRALHEFCLHAAPPPGLVLGFGDAKPEDIVRAGNALVALIERKTRYSKI